MIATTDDFTSHLAAHAGIAAPLAERVAHIVLAGIGGSLSPAIRRLVADELPPELAAQVVAGADLATPIEARVCALDANAGHARELVASVCRVLAEELSVQAIAAIRAAVPTGIAALLVVPTGAEPPPGPEPRPDVLADGRIGSRHPVSESRASGAHGESIAAGNPHAATKLSSATGSTQERRRETLAEGRPGSPRPLAGRRRR